jgi:hypothetical protein
MDAANDIIQRSSSSAAAQMVFAKKNDSGQQLCVEYWALNSSSFKNRHPLPHLLEMIDQTHRAWIFTKLDLQNPYHLVQIKEGDKCMTTFQTCYGQVECKVMPVGLTNGAVTDHAYIDDRLWRYIGDFAICNLDDCYRGI